MHVPRKSVVGVSVLLVAAPITQSLAIGVLKSFTVSFILYTLIVCVGGTFIIGAFVWGKLRMNAIGKLFGLLPVKKNHVVLGLVLGIFIDAIMILGFWIFYKAFNNAGAVVATAQKLGIQGGALLWVAIAGLVINAIAEELFWRGGSHAFMGLQPTEGGAKLFSALQDGALSRILVVSLFFGVNHIGIMLTIAPSLSAALLSLLGILLSGIMWSYLRELTKSLIPSLVSHVLVTLGYSGLLVFYFYSV